MTKVMSFDGKLIFPSNLVPVPDNHYVIDVSDLHDIIDVDKDLGVTCELWHHADHDVIDLR